MGGMKRDELKPQISQMSAGVLTKESTCVNLRHLRSTHPDKALWQILEKIGA
jgi:hypothetical protein